MWSVLSGAVSSRSFVEWSPYLQYHLATTNKILPHFAFYLSERARLSFSVKWIHNDVQRCSKLVLNRYLGIVLGLRENCYLDNITELYREDRVFLPKLEKHPTAGSIHSFMVNQKYLLSCPCLPKRIFFILTQCRKY